MMPFLTEHYGNPSSIHGFGEPVRKAIGLPCLAPHCGAGSDSDHTTMMELLAKLLPTQNIELKISATSKKRVFEYASILFENNQGIERSKVFDSLLARERLGSLWAKAFAMPHGPIKGLKESVIAIISVENPVAFDAPDERAVSLMVFLLVPEHATQQHLDILSGRVALGSNQRGCLQCAGCR